MIKSILKSVLVLVIYFALFFGFTELFKFVFIREEFIDVNPDYFLLISPLLSLFFIGFMVLLIRKTFLVSNEIVKADFKTILFIIFISCVYFIFKEPLVRMDFILREKVIPETIRITNESVMSLTITFFNIVILTPIFEELLFRKIMLGFFSKKHFLTGIIVSSIMFALIHVYSIELDIMKLISLFVFGFVACLVYIRLGFLYNLMFHVVSNLIWFFVNINREEYWEVLRVLDFGYIYWLVSMLSFAILFYFIFISTKRIVKKNKTELNYLNENGDFKPSLYSVFLN